MSRVIFTNKTVDFKDCEVIFTNCKLRMKNCELTDNPVCADEQSRVILENQSLKNDIERLNAEVESLKRTIGEYAQTIIIFNCQRNSFEESSDLTTVQSSETLGSVDSEENAKLCENRVGSF